MDLATMRAEFVSSSGFAGDLTDSEIDAKLNLFYRFVVPSDVDGSLSEIIWTGTMNTVYPYVAFPEYIVALNDPSIWVNDSGTTTFLSVESDFGRFVQRYPDSATTTGKPTAACFFGRTALFFDRVPDSAYEFQVECRGGDANELTSAGIADDIHALTVIHGAAWHFLLGVEDESGAAREGGQYEIFKSMLLTRSNSAYRRRTPARSF